MLKVAGVLSGGVSGMTGWMCSSLARASVAVLTFAAGGVVGASAASAASPTCDGQAATIVASTDDEQLVGTEGADVIVVEGDSVDVTALGGDDLICVAAGAYEARVDAGSGDDRVEDRFLGVVGPASVELGPGDDSLQGNGGTRITYLTSAAPVTVDLGDGTATGDAVGTDTFTGVRGVYGSKQPGDVLTGSARVEEFYDTGGAGVIDAGGGDDWIRTKGDSRVAGGEGNDYISVTGAASVDGGAGDDTIKGSAAQMSGGEGQDRLLNDGGSTDGGEGDDDVTVYSGGVGYGGPGDDVMVGEGGDRPELAVQLYGDEGADVLHPSLRTTPSPDLIDGGMGNDTIALLSQNVGVVADLASGYLAARGSSSRTTLRSVENVFGTPFDDRITGDGRANLIDGFGGADLLRGLDGGDTLRGGDGRDRAEGGSGRDICDAETTRSC